MAERSNAAVLKTVEGQLSGGSNPSLSAKCNSFELFWFQRVVFYYLFKIFGSFDLFQLFFVKLFDLSVVRVVEDNNLIIKKNNTVYKRVKEFVSFLAVLIFHTGKISQKLLDFACL